MPDTGKRVLLVEDDPDDAFLIERVLRRPLRGGIRHRVTHVSTLAEALAYSDAQPVDVVLLDLGLPDSQGLATLKSASDGMPSAAIVVLTGLEDEAIGVDAIRLGAQDYLPKSDLQPEVVRNALRYAWDRHQIQMELRKRNAELQLLQRVAAATSHTIELQELYPSIAEALRESELLGRDNEIRLFLREDSGLHLVFHTGPPPACAGKGSERAQDCLCGLAAGSGAAVVSADAEADPRHTARNRDMGRHGNVVVPLEAKGGVVGVLCLYTRPNEEVRQEQLRLLESIGSQVGMAVENARLYEQTRRLAWQDPLTGLGNRRLMDMMLEKHFAEAERRRYGLSVVMLDIDDFKRFNDTHGHEAGDRLLQELGRVIAADIRSGDSAARYGGEEFLLLLPAADTGQAVNLAERLRQSVARRTGTTISLGVCSYTPGLARDQMIRLADRALYEAKAAGKNRVEVAKVIASDGQ